MTKAKAAPKAKAITLTQIGTVLGEQIAALQKRAPAQRDAPLDAVIDALAALKAKIDGV